jgi:hypothetical protein
MNHRIIFVLFSLLLLHSSLPGLQADPKGEQLVNRYLSQSARRSAIFNMGVDYQEAGKESIHLEFTWMRKAQQGLMSHLIKMEAPPSEKGKLLLVHEKPDGDSDYIAYRPNSALKKKVRVSGARNYKFKGITISVQELIGGELQKYDHQAKGTKPIEGIQCHEVENRIKPQFKNDSNYPRSVVYFREDNGMLQKWELFGDSDKLEKVITADEIKKIQGNWTLTIARVEDLKKKGKLILKLIEGHYDPSLSDELFNEEYLKQNSK